MLRVLFAIAVALPPVPAAYIAAAAVGRPDIAPELVRVCERESRCQPIGLHERDADARPRGGFGAQVRLGHLRPWCQRKGLRRWSTRGAFGLWASAHWRYLPACYPPEVLDVPLVSALVAARKYVRTCTTARRSGWCPGTLRHGQHARRRLRVHRS